MSLIVINLLLIGINPGPNILPMKTAVGLWSNIIAMELPSSHIPSLLEPFLI